MKSAHYHQLSDEYDSNWNFKGLIQLAEVAMAISVRAANAPALQKFNPSDEFAKNSQR